MLELVGHCPFSEIIRLHCKLIACEVVAREVCYCASRARNTVDIELFTQGLHDNADSCRATLQERINAADPAKFQAVLLAYGLCNNALVGIRAGRVKMVVPRAHDCITFLLGSKERYAREFSEHPGTYYYSAGWLEYPGRGGERIPYNQKSGLAKRMAYEELARKYGEENAQFIQEIMSGWQQHYTRGACVEFPFYSHLGISAQVNEICLQNGWSYADVPGDIGLLQGFLDGAWDDDRFLTLEPGQAIRADYGDKIVDVAAE